MSGAQSSKFPDYAPISTMNSFSPAPHSPLSIPIDPQRSSLVSSGSSDVSAATTTLQSELDRELATSADSCNKIPPANPNSLYSHNENNVNSVVDPSHSSYPIDPNLEQSSSRPKSPELDIFAMLDRMSIRGGSIHRNTAQFYDPPQLSSSHRQSSHDMHNPYPINIHDQANISELEQGANETLDSTSQSFRTMRPDSPAGFHEQLSASSLSSRTGFKAHTERENVVRQLPSTPRPERSHVGQLAGSSTEDQLNVNSRGFSIDRNSADHEKNNVYRGRGAWSDDERASYQTDNVLQGPIPSKAVQRDLRKILNTIGHNDSRRAAATDSLGQYLDSIQHQLKNVAAKLKAHGPEREPGFEVEENEEPTIADKVDYMLSLCNILLESQHKVSTAVEQNLRAHGLNIDNNSVRTRSLGSGFKNSTRHCSYVSPEPGMPGPAPLTPAGSYLDEDRSKAGSPPLPPLPDNEAAEEQEEPTPEALPPVAVQEAGLGRIENLLVALLNRMDDAAQRPQESVAPPVPEKELSVTEPRQSSFGGTNSSILDLDADVALWKSRARGDEASSCGKESDSKSFSQEPEADFANVEGKNVSSESTETASTPQNYQTIPDYNLAYEAEEEVARRIADERARAARRLEGASTPLHYHQLGLSSRYPVPFGARAPIQSVEVTNFTPPNQDFDPYRLSVSSKNATFQKAQDHSYWSKTTNTENINEDPVPPPPPPKDDQASTRSHSQPASSIRSPSRVSSSVISSRKSPPRPISANPEPVLSSIPPEQIRELLMEVLQQHSTEKEPVFDEMVSVLRNQDQGKTPPFFFFFFFLS
ncbi:expressed protein [Phakopsora pachyrhizi]|uniref:Expressed protein n=1 Tax=Phakopsora pachyrhizi TaxID=170000 RepID=A0AAV0BT90_PHAPC|nr:expressed protein [Phakopsora pachyrhizi]